MLSQVSIVRGEKMTNSGPILILGASGFLGSHISTSLTEQGIPWIGTTRSRDSQDLTFFEDLELPRILINRIHLFKEECSAWFQALRIVQDRGYVLTSDEQQALERSL